MTSDQRLEDRDALIAHYRSSREAFWDAVAGLPDDVLTERTIDGWSVKDHMAHLAHWDDIRASEIERMSAGFASAWLLQSGEDDTINAIVTPARWNLSLAQVKWEFERARRRVVEALERATPEALDASKYGEAALVSQHELQHTGWIREWREQKGV